MLKVGLTGGIGAGKSTVAKVFSLLGIPIYYADIEAKRILNNDEDLKLKIIKLFGEQAYINSNYNAAFIRSKIVKNNLLFEKLNELVHPKVKQHLLDWFTSKSAHFYAIEEAALIKSKTGLDKIILVQSPLDLRIKRIQERDPHRSIQEINEIIQNQNSEKEFLNLADFVIQNNEKELITTQVLKIHSILSKK